MILATLSTGYDYSKDLTVRFVSFVNRKVEVVTYQMNLDCDTRSAKFILQAILDVQTLFGLDLASKFLRVV